MTELQLGNDYFDLWETTDDAERHALIEKVFVDSAVQYVAPANISLEGADAIEANITRVNTENIQKAGLQFQKGKIIPNHNSVQVEWTVAAPNGQTVASGRDFLLLGEDGRATALYMFQG
ncbi:hypothetical protein ACIPY2_18705 [Paenarthrobacter sp. NPDC089675]|uniref:hypothetical protein n=1 Tax=Paenarthrobacter sp. NPDC089675 TaxID=3364376 RepID=UPI0037F699CD